MHIESSKKYSLTAWYISTERVCQLIGREQLLRHANDISGINDKVAPGSAADITRSLLVDELRQWLVANEVPSLEELILKNTVKEGNRITIFHDFYGRLRGTFDYNKKPFDPKKSAELHTKSKLLPDCKIRILYSPNNLTSDTAWSRMSGRSRLFGFGYIESVSKEEIIIRPYIIGDFHYDLEVNDVYINADTYGEVSPFAIDAFSEMSKLMDHRVKKSDLRVFKEISEREIKEAFAEIIGEESVPPDWGGEKSDLFTSRLKYQEKYIPAAFLFKGPAKFHPMKAADLGKNGDQIDRLFTEPANMFILQHCHEVTTPVRSTMRAYSSRIQNLSLFSIIDGYDTYRLLKAYNKCGL